MLKIYIRNIDDYNDWQHMEHIGNVSEYFKFEYEPEWLEDEFVRRIIKK